MSPHSKIEMTYREFSSRRKEPIKARDAKTIPKDISEKVSTFKGQKKVSKSPTASGGKMVAVSKGLGYLGIGVEIEETVGKWHMSLYKLLKSYKQFNV